MGASDDSGIWRIIVRIGVVLGIIASLIAIVVFVRGTPNTTGSGLTSTATSPTTASTSGDTQGSASPTKPPAQAAATATLQPPRPGTVVYRADWSGGMGGWTGDGEWKTVNGMAVTSGYSNGDPLDGVLLAPYTLGTLSDYTIEAQIKIDRVNCCTGGIGIVARVDTGASPPSGYFIGGANLSAQSPYDGDAAVATGNGNLCTYCQGMLKYVPFSPGSDWHDYRAEVQGNTIRLFIDGGEVLETTDNTFLAGGRCGLYAENGFEVSVRSFVVTAL